MLYLKNLCVLIFSGVSLYNGSKTRKGMVAVYGKGNFARSLYNDNTKLGRSNIQSFIRHKYNDMLRVTKLPGANDGAHFCLPSGIGMDGLEKYLSLLGFQKSDLNDEKETTDEFLRNEAILFELEDKTVKAHTPEVGRKIAAAVTNGKRGLAGSYSCASSKENPIKYKLKMSLPINMGELQMISSHVDKHSEQCLVYINSNLRIIRRLRQGALPTFDINPKLDNFGNNGLLDREVLDVFFSRQYMNNQEVIARDPILKTKVFIGGYNHSESLETITVDD